MATVTPSQVSAANVNAELNVSSTLTMSLSNNWVKNVAAIPTSTTTLNYGRLRWGINFPGIQPDPAAGGFGYSDANTPYRLANSANILYSVIAVQSTGSVTANARIQINSNGILKYIIGSATSGNPGGGTADIRTRTWLTSGTNSDYTANLVITTGSFDAGSSASNTDLLLSTTRNWTVTVVRASPGASSQLCSGVMIIKNDGVEIFRRPWRISVSATFASTFP